MKLEPGFYKIRLGNGAFDTFHYLRVFNKNGQLFYQLDHGIPELVKGKLDETVLDNSRIVKKISKPITVNNIKTTVAFEDEDGDCYEFSARNILSLKRIFSEFPRVAKGFGIK